MFSIEFISVSALFQVCVSLLQREGVCVCVWGGGASNRSFAPGAVFSLHGANIDIKNKKFG